ncbi:MAG TPA: FHA domain-containing protein [Rhodothermales bacterium]
MQVRISVTSAADAGDTGPFVFTKDRVTIGRDPSCDLVLPDPKRIVSKEHAAIERAESGFYLIDLGSKNFTFLNGARLPSGKPQALAIGDAIKIGEYELSFAVTEDEPEPVPSDDRTVFLVNPFDAGARQLAATLEAMEAAYENEIPGRREEALRQAFRNAFGDRIESLADLLSQGLGLSGGASNGASVEPVPVVRPVAPPVARSVNESKSAYERVFDVLIRMVPRLLGIPWRFRHEFIGQTIMHSPDAAALFEGEPEDARRYLLDPNEPDEELERRAGLLNDAADDLLMHALAMVDGYKGSVQQGLARMLDEIDPARIEEQLAEGGAGLKNVPLLREKKIVEQLKAKLDELRGEDWAVAERRIYRPAFIKSYLARMTSRRKPAI